MRAYRIQVAGIEDTIVFAGNMEHAAEIFVTQWYATRESTPPNFLIGRLQGAANMEERIHLEEALLWGMAGFARYIPDVGWHIDPPS